MKFISFRNLFPFGLMTRGTLCNAKTAMHLRAIDGLP